MNNNYRKFIYGLNDLFQARIISCLNEMRGEKLSKNDVFLKICGQVDILRRIFEKRFLGHPELIHIKA